MFGWWFRENTPVLDRINDAGGSTADATLFSELQWLRSENYKLECLIATLHCCESCAICSVRHILLSEHIDSTNRGAKEEIKSVGLSVRRNIPLLQLWFLSEFVFNRFTIFTGGITQFAAKENTVRKWVMNRPFQARFAESLIEIAG